MRVRELELQDVTRWDVFVQRCHEATFFHRAGWKYVIEQAFGHKCYFLYVERHNEIVGVLPLGHIRSLMFGNALISTPFCVYGGCLAIDEQAKHILEEYALRLAGQLHVDYMELRHRQPRHMDWPCKSDLYVTFRKEIDPLVEQNMLNIPRKQRAMVRKGIEAGLVSEIDQDINRFFGAYAQSVRNLGTPVFSKKYFELLKKNFDKDCEILTVVKDNQVVTSVMSFYFRDEVLPYYGGGTDMARQYKGNDFMYWELMRRACEKGIKVFDYGRSKVGTGSYHFKKNWGFEPVPLHYEYHLVRARQVPDINPLNPKYRIFIEFWKRLPLSIANVIGPVIVKNLG